MLIRQGEPVSNEGHSSGEITSAGRTRPGCRKETADLRFGFVSGHDFSRAVKDGKRFGL
jgi:hypothetical protein